MSSRRQKLAVVAKRELSNRASRLAAVPRRQRGRVGGDVPQIEARPPALAAPGAAGEPAAVGAETQGTVVAPSLLNHHQRRLGEVA